MATTKPIKRAWPAFVLAAAIAALAYALYQFIPPYTLDPFCTYDVIYRLTATIDVDGQPYSSEVVRQNSFSRKWISMINSAGCQQTYGTALSFRLPDARVVLTSTFICQSAKRELEDSRSNYTQVFERAMAERRQADVAALCSGRIQDVYPASQAHGYIVDDADRPTRWQPFRFGEKVAKSDTIIRLVTILPPSRPAYLMPRSNTMSGGTVLSR
jgi:hypothetical protein